MSNRLDAAFSTYLTCSLQMHFVLQVLLLLAFVVEGRLAVSSTDV